MNVNAAVFSLKNLFIKDKGLIWTFSSAFTGILSGTLIYSFVLSKIDNPIMDLFVKFNTDFTDKSEIEIFSGIAVGTLIYFLALFLSGTSFIGKYLCLFITFFKTIGIGSLIAFLYVQYGLKGLEYVLLIFFPGKIILFLSLILMTKSSFDMSTEIKNGIYEKGSTASFIKVYYLKSLFLMFLFILSAVVDFFTVKIFSSLFNFVIL